MHAHVCRPGAAGTDAIEQSQLPVSPVDSEGADRAFVAFAHPVRLVGGIQAGPCGIQSQAARTRTQLADTARCQAPGGAIHLKQVNAASISGRQIHLRRRHVAQWRTECAHIGHKRPPGFGRRRRKQTRYQQCDDCWHGKGLQKRVSGKCRRIQVGRMLHGLVSVRSKRHEKPRQIASSSSPCCLMDRY